MWYSIDRKDNTVKVKKEISTDERIKVKLVRLDNCGNVTILSDVNATSEVTISMPQDINDLNNTSLYNIVKVSDIRNVSGIYQLQITLGNYKDIVEYPNYNILLKSVVEDIENILCKCPCEDCPDCKEDNKTLLDVTFKVILYYSLTGKYYQSKLSKLLSCIGCELKEESICLIVNSVINGNKQNIILLKKLLAMYYLAFYHTDNSTNCQTTSINTIYKYNSIKGCLVNLGIDLNCIDRKLQDSLTSTGDSHIFLTSYDNVIVGKRYFIETLPQYFDSFSRPIKKIKIFNINMQVEGTNKDRLVFNNVDVTEGQEIEFSDIENNKLIFIPAQITADKISTFDWRITSFC